MKTILHKTFVRDLKKIKDKSLLEKVAEIIQEVEAAKSLNEIANLKKLSGYSYAYRIRVGVYRIGLHCEAESVSFVRFQHRKDIYRSFP